MIWSEYASTRPHVAAESPAHEAAKILIRNREALLSDAAGWLYAEGYDLMSIQDMDAALRRVVIFLLNSNGSSVGGDEANQHHVADLLTYLDARMCVPRDMGNPPATSIRDLLRSVTAVVERV